MTRTEAQEYIREHATEYFTRDKSGKGYICPICGSGSGKHGTGITENPKSKGHFTCWSGGDSCFQNADIFEIIGKVHGLTDFNEIFSRACSDFGVYVDSDNSYSPTATATTAKTADNEKYDFRELYKEARKHIEETEYHRGISLETLREYWIGYIPEWRHPKSPNTPATPRLIIPNSFEGYLARDTRDNLTDSEKKYAKQRAGHVGIWNVKAISTAEKPVFVFEGELDALSVIDVGGMAVALCSTSNAKKFLDAVAQRKPKLGFILSLDNDKAGKEATEIISAGLTELIIPYCVHELPTQYKDANEFLMTDRTAFEEWVNQGDSDFRKILAANNEQAREEFENESVYSDLGNFIKTLMQSREGKSIATGFEQLDTLLDGGLYPGLYFIGALSSLGKTAITLQIADNIAKNGRGVLFFSLEMSRNELIARSLSRLTYKLCKGNTRIAKTTRGILRGNFADFNPAEKEILEQAVNEYSEYAHNLFISEGVGDIGVGEIRKKVDRFMRFNEGVPPVIVIDYAQILAPANEKYTDKQNTDKNVLELKRISRDYHIPVFAISSLNRENYTEPINMASFKESGAIEYSSDCLLGLQYAGWDYQDNEKEGDHKRRVRERLDVISKLAKQGIPIDIECKVLKNRNGAKDKFNLRFYPMFNFFEEVL